MTESVRFSKKIYVYTFEPFLDQVRTWGRFGVRFSHLKVSIGSHCENRVENRGSIWKPPNTSINPVLMGVIKLENRLHENQQSKTLDLTPKSMGFLFLEYFIDLKSKGFPFYKRMLDLGSMSLLKVKNQPRMFVTFLSSIKKI
jgi:hypothetical protein